MGINASDKTGRESTGEIVENVNDDGRVFVEDSTGEAASLRSPGQPRGSQHPHAPRHPRTPHAPHKLGNAPRILGKQGRTLLAVVITAATVLLGVTAVSAANADTGSVPAPVIVSPTDGSSTNQMSPPVNGTGVSGDTITVYDGSTLLASDIGILSDGYWQMPNSPILAPGSHTLTAIQTDSSGDTSPASTPITFSVTPTPGVDSPVITTPTNDSVTNNTNLQVSGTIVDGSGTVVGGNRVTVWDGSTVIATFLGAAGGTWYTSLPTNFALGTHVLTAAQVDTNGDISAVSAPVTFTVVAAPVYPAPVITSPTDGATTNNTTPQISGTAVSGDGDVTLYDGATEVASGIGVGSDGSWQQTLSTPLADGTHIFTAVQIDGSGTTSAVSAPVTFTITAAPAIAAPVITSPTDGTTTSDVNTGVRGTGTPGDTVTLSDGSTVIASDLQVQGDGTWWVSSTLYFAPGTHTLTAVQADSSGDISAASTPVTLIIPAGATIAAPVITSPTDGTTTSDVNTGVRGTGIPGNVVNLSDGSTVIASGLQIQSDGSWWVSSTPLFLPGTHTLTAVQVDPAGHVSATSAAVTFTTASTGSGIAAPVITTPTDGWVTNNTSLGVTGTGTPGDYVVVFEGSTVLWPSLEVLSGGNWYTSSSVTLPVGTHTLTAVQVDSSGNIGVASAQVTITISGTPVVAAPVITAPTDGTVTNNTKPVVSGTGVANGTVTVSVDDGAQTFTQSIDGDGNWASGLNVPLSVGTHTLTATDSNGLGNTSDVSAPVTFTVTSAPIGDAPVIVTPADGSTTNSTSPYISGTGTPGDNVTVSDSGTVIASAAVLSDGKWWNSATLNLADGTHTLTAVQADGSGNTSPVSNSVSLTVVLLPVLAPPVITSPTDGTVTNNATPKISGTGVAGDWVALSDGSTVLNSTIQVQSDGTWWFTPTTALSDGVHVFTATQSNTSEQVSGVSNTVSVTVQAPAPAAPVITAPANGSTVTTATPVISGTGVPGAVVTVSDASGALSPTATVGSDGTWSLVPSTALANGSYIFTAVQSNANGTSAVSAGVNATVSVQTPPPSGGSSSGPSLSDVLNAIVNVVATIVKTIVSVVVSIRSLFSW